MCVSDFRVIQDINGTVVILIRNHLGTLCTKAICMCMLSILWYCKEDVLVPVTLQTFVSL